MDFGLDPDQSLLEQSARVLLERAAGPARARSLHQTGRCDRELLQALAGAGMLDLFADPEAGPLEAALVTEWSAAAAAYAPVGARCLVAPSVMTGDIPPAIGLVESGGDQIVRWGHDLDALIVLTGDDARVLGPSQFTATQLPSRFAYPLATIELTGPGEPAAPGSAATARQWWRVALAAELAGTMTAAVGLTKDYISARRQFGRPIGSFQALQHRLAEAMVAAEAVRWMAREAAFSGSPEAAAAAATYAADAAYRVFMDVHQLHGAMGFTTDYDLYLWSTRLAVARLELGGPAAHADALAAIRWREAASAAP
jgi:alkylation response protein AidB-like acyl-CoA dehydrogenase